MATLSVLKFDTPDGAKQMEQTLLALQKQQLITIQDAAIVTWPQGKKGPKTEQLHSLAGQGALMGALSGKFADYGIDDNFIKQTRDKVTEGTSALFLLTSGAVMDKLVEAVKGQKFEIISTNLSKEQEDQLKAAFGGE